MSSQIILTGLTREQLQEDIFKTVSKLLESKKNVDLLGVSLNGFDFSVEEETTRKQTKLSTTPVDKYLTRAEVARLLKISLPTLHRYTKDGILKSYRIVGKVRYKLQDVENALKERNFGLPKKGGSNA
jgi:excisionase family DNA binding protein